MDTEGREGNPGTIDAALLWLNDRLGHEVELNVRVDVGGHSITLVEAAGELKHWRHNPEAVRLQTALDPEGRREDLRGRYLIGPTVLDWSQVPPQADIDLAPWGITMSAGDWELSVAAEQA